MEHGSHAYVGLLWASLILASVFVSSCDHSLPATTVTIPQSSQTSPVSVRAGQPLVSRWPSELAAAVLRRENGFAVADSKGERFQITAAGGMGTYAEIVASNNGRYLAYRFSGGDLVVLAVKDGKVLGKMATRPTDDVKAISDDGRYVVLVDEGLGPGIWAASLYPRSRQVVTILDLQEGRSHAPEAIASLVTGTGERKSEYWLGRCVAWLPGQDAFVFSVFGPTYSLCLYDPARDTLRRIDGIEYLGAISRTGAILGYVQAEEGTPMPNGLLSDHARPVVWQAGRSTSFDLDSSWFSYRGAMSPDGGIAVMAVINRKGTQQMEGWQLFKETGGKWRPVSQLYQYAGPEPSPLTVSNDSRVIWGYTTSAAEDFQYSELVSLDLTTGVWRSWPQKKDLRVSQREFRLEIPIFEHEL